jgi:DUF4097 and DUF4098 domain-containing protein YvlB
MTIRPTLHYPLAAILAAVFASTAGAQSQHPIRTAYQGGRNGGPEQTEHITKKIKVGRDSRLSVENFSGDIIVTGGTGDEIAIDAAKHARGDKTQLQNLDVDIEDHGGMVMIRTNPMMRGSRVWVDYTITVPAATALELNTISGDIKVTNVQGVVRGQAVSGNVTMTGTPNLESAKTVSGDVSLSGVSTSGDVSAGSGSGTLTAAGIKARSLDLNSISGDVVLTDIVCDRVTTKSISGDVEFGGRILKSGRYEVTSHSGDVRLQLQNPGGFELNASSFSGTIRADMNLTVHSEPGERSGNRRGGGMNHTLQATYGDGSASLIIKTFSGDVVLTER